MKPYRKLRRSAYFVDFILIVVALVAMIGLAAFVRLHATKAPDEAEQESALTQSIQHIDTLQPVDSTNSNDSAPTSSSTNDQASDAINNSINTDLQSAASAPEAKSPASACGKDCDSVEISTPKVSLPLVPVTVQPVTLNYSLDKCSKEHSVKGIASNLLHAECIL